MKLELQSAANFLVHLIRRRHTGSDVQLEVSGCHRGGFEAEVSRPLVPWEALQGVRVPLHPNQRQNRPHHSPGGWDRGYAYQHHPPDLPLRADHVDRPPGGLLPDRRERVHLYSLRVQGEPGDGKRPLAASPSANHPVPIQDVLPHHAGRGERVHHLGIQVHSDVTTAVKHISIIVTG